MKKVRIISFNGIKLQETRYGTVPITVCYPAHFHVLCASIELRY